MGEHLAAAGAERLKIGPALEKRKAAVLVARLIAGRCEYVVFPEADGTDKCGGILGGGGQGEKTAAQAGERHGFILAFKRK